MAKETTLLVAGLIFILVGITILVLTPKRGEEFAFNIKDGSYISLEVSSYEESQEFTIVDEILEVYRFTSYHKVFLRIEDAEQNVSPMDFALGLIHF